MQKKTNQNETSKRETKTLIKNNEKKGNKNPWKTSKEKRSMKEKINGKSVENNNNNKTNRKKREKNGGGFCHWYFPNKCL